MLPFRGPLEWKGIAEAERCARIGLREVMILNLPSRPYHDLYYEPLWEVLEDIGLPVVTHTATQEEQLDLTVTAVPLNAWSCRREDRQYDALFVAADCGRRGSAPSRCAL